MFSNINPFNFRGIEAPLFHRFEDGERHFLYLLIKFAYFCCSILDVLCSSTMIPLLSPNHFQALEPPSAMGMEQPKNHKHTRNTISFIPLRLCVSSWEQTTWWCFAHFYTFPNWNPVHLPNCCLFGYMISIEKRNLNCSKYTIIYNEKSKHMSKEKFDNKISTVYWKLIDIKNCI